jgi:hypothetical protein
MLPGGRYFAMTDRWNEFGLWEVATGRCLWSHPQHVSGWTFDMVDGGSAALVACHVRYSKQVFPNHSSPSALSHFRSKNGIEIFHPSSAPTLRGDFYAMPVERYNNIERSFGPL